MPNRIKVKVILVDGQATLIQSRHEGVLGRKVVPSRKVEGGSVDIETWEAGIVYGQPWEDLWVPHVTAKAIAQALREHGIWDESDLRRNPGRALAALQSVYRLDLMALLSATENAVFIRNGEK